MFVLKQFAGDIDVPFTLQNVIKVDRDVILEISIWYIIKLFCLIQGSLGQNISPFITLYSNMAGYPAKNNVLVPRQVVTHMQNIGNNWVVEFLTLKSLQ